MQHFIVSGHIGRDAETRVSSTGVKATSFSLASSYTVKGDKKTDWFRCTVFDERGEKLAPYLKKGTSVVVSGTVQARGYLKDGEARAELQVVVRDLDFMSSSKTGGSTGGDYVKAKGQGHAPGDLDDEIPFAPVQGLP